MSIERFFLPGAGQYSGPAFQADCGTAIHLQNYPVRIWASWQSGSKTLWKRVRRRLWRSSGAW